MKTYLLLCIAAAFVSAARGACDACVDGRCLRKQPLPNYLNTEYDINRNTNVFYDTARKEDTDYISQCNLNTLTCNDTEIPWVLRDLTVDQRTGDLYAASLWGLGLYKLDLVINERALLVDELIEHMMFKDKLYYSVRNSSGIYTYDDGFQQIVPGSEDYVFSEFVVDKNGDIYFKDEHDKAIKQLKYGTGTANYFYDIWNHLSTDKDGNAMIINQNSFAVYRVVNDQLVEVGAVTEYVYSILFDGDNNLIYAANNNYGRYYLKPVTDVQCSTGRGDTLQRQIMLKPVRTTTPKTIESTFTSTTPAHEPSNTPDDNNTSNTNQQQTDQEGQKEGRKKNDGKLEEDQTCTCNTPKLPSVTVKVEFN